MDFHKNLKMYREKLNISARSFAKKLNIPYTTYLAYETTNREPKFATLMKIATALNVSIDDLLGYNKEDKDDLTQGIDDLKRLGFKVEECTDEKDTDRYFLITPPILEKPLEIPPFPQMYPCLLDGLRLEAVYSFFPIYVRDTKLKYYINSIRDTSAVFINHYLANNKPVPHMDKLSKAILDNSQDRAKNLLGKIGKEPTSKD